LGRTSPVRPAQEDRFFEDWIFLRRDDRDFVVFCFVRPEDAEGIVSKKVDGTYRSGPCRVWIKVRNPASTAVQRERSTMWNR
jgi:hypothetical protein